MHQSLRYLLMLPNTNPSWIHSIDLDCNELPQYNYTCKIICIVIENYCACTEFILDECCTTNVLSKGWKSAVAHCSLDVLDNKMLQKNQWLWSFPPQLYKRGLQRIAKFYYKIDIEFGGTQSKKSMTCSAKWLCVRKACTCSKFAVWVFRIGSRFVQLKQPPLIIVFILFMFRTNNVDLTFDNQWTEWWVFNELGKSKRIENIIFGGGSKIHFTRR